MLTGAHSRTLGRGLRRPACDGAASILPSYLSKAVVSACCLLPVTGRVLEGGGFARGANDVQRIGRLARRTIAQPLCGLLHVHGCGRRTPPVGCR